MIPNEFKILRLQRLVQLTFIVFLIMSQIMTPALSVSEPECNNRNVKLKMFFSTAVQGSLAVVNNTITTVSNGHYLYTINGERLSPQFYIFDPVAKIFICLGKNSHRFIAKQIPKPRKMCLFNEVIDKEKSGEIKLMVKNHTLAVTKKGQIPTNTVPKKRRHFKKFQYFIALCKSEPSIVAKLCALLPPKERHLKKFKQQIKCPA